MKLLACYKGDKYIWAGTKAEIAERIGKTENMIKFMLTPTYQKRLVNQRHYKDPYIIIRLEMNDD
jgi:hypothetical protein